MVVDQIEFLTESAHRLGYPLNYWNGLAAFLARTELAEGQEVCIVDKELPHLIELLDPVGF